MCSLLTHIAGVYADVLDGYAPPAQVRGAQMGIWIDFRQNFHSACVIRFTLTWYPSDAKYAKQSHRGARSVLLGATAIVAKEV